MDLAELGIKITSGDARAASGALDTFAASAGRADAANTALGNSVKQTAAQKRAAAAAAALLAEKEKQEAAAAKAAAVAQRELDRSMNRTAMQARLLSFQVNDVFTMIASGQAPLMTATQQVGQFTQVLNEMGGRASIIRGLGAAFTQVLNPITLVTFGVIALGGTIAQWMFSSGEEVASLDDAFDELFKSVEAVNEISKTYSADGLQALSEKYGQVNEQVLTLIERQNELAQNAAMESANTAIGMLRDEYGSLLDMIDAGGKAGQAATFELANALGLSANEGVRLREAMDEAIAAMTFEEKASALATVNSILGQSSVKTGELYSKTVQAEDAMLQLANSAPSANWMDAAISGVTGLIGSIYEAITATGTLAGAQAQTLAANGKAISPQRMDPREYEQDPYYRSRYLPDAAALATPKRKSGGGRSGKSEGERAAEKAQRDAEALAKKYKDLVANQNEYILMSELEARTIGMTEVEADKLLRTQELLNQATGTGIKLTPEMTKELTNLAIQSAESEAKIKSLTDAFEFRSDLIRGALDGIRSALDDGKITWEEIGDIAVSTLDKIIDKLLNDLPDALAGLTTGGTGGGGGILGLLGGLLGIGGSSLSPLASNAIANGLGGLYASGGFTGKGGKNDPAGIVHKGEFVFSAEAVKAYGLANLEAMHRGAKGYSAGGAVGMSTSSRPWVPTMPANRDSANGNAQVFNNFTIDARGAQQGVGEEIRKALAVYDEKIAPNTARRAVQMGQKYGVSR